MHGTMPGARKRGRPRTAWMDNIKTWTGLPVEESVRMTTEDRDKWRVRPWCGQPWYRGRIKNRTEQTQRRRGCAISSCAVPVGPSFPHTPSQRPSVANKNTRYSAVLLMRRLISIWRYKYRRRGAGNSTKPKELVAVTAAASRCLALEPAVARQWGWQGAGKVQGAQECRGREFQAEKFVTCTKFTNNHNS